MFDFDINEVSEVYDNPILTDEKKAFSLIVNILERVKKNSELQKIDNLKKIIENDLRNIISNVEIKDQIELYNRIAKNVEKIYEINLSPKLKNKNIIAVAGGFSAGKSTFLNSLLNLSIELPENIDPCSAIPTYIIFGNEDKIETINFFSKNFNLTVEEFKAISHQFQDKYNISFSQILSKIVISSNKIYYNNICFLDTPGYTKSNTNLKSNNTDREKAKKHLIAADNLIWICDVENGIIKKEDLNFINSLNWNKEKKILFILNKSDKKQDFDREQIREAVRKELEKNKINYFGIALYSSLERKEYNGNYIEQFLSYFEQQKHEPDFINQLQMDIDFISSQLDSKKLELKKEDTIIGNCIKNNKKHEISNYKYILNILKENNTQSYEYLKMNKVLNDKIKIEISKILESTRGVV